MRKAISGFTVIELIIVVVIIGILASIVLVAYSSSRNNAQNTSRVAELKEWQKTFVQYKAANNGVYPSMSDGGYCLGTQFPNGGKCRDYNGGTVYTEAASTSLMSALSTYDPPKGSPRVPVGGTVGPYAIYSSTQIVLYAVLNGGASDCPAATSYGWTDGAGLVLCTITLTR